MRYPKINTGVHGGPKLDTGELRGLRGALGRAIGTAGSTGGGLQRVWGLLGTPEWHSQAAVAGVGLRLLLTRRLGVHRRGLAAGEAGCEVGGGGSKISTPTMGQRWAGQPQAGGVPRFSGVYPCFCCFLTVGVGGVAGVPQPLEARLSLPHQLLGGQACREGDEKVTKGRGRGGGTHISPPASVTYGASRAHPHPPPGPQPV